MAASGRWFREPFGLVHPQKKAAIASARSAWEGIDHVTGVTDPFATQTELDKARTDLEAARTKLVDGGEHCRRIASPSTTHNSRWRKARD